MESHGIGLEDWEAREGSLTTIGSTEIESTESGSTKTWFSEGSGILWIGSNGGKEERDETRSEWISETEAWGKTKLSKIGVGDGGHSA